MGRNPVRTTKGPRGRRMTVLDCELGQHSGAFTITSTPLGWGCDRCIQQLADADRTGRIA